MKKAFLFLLFSFLFLCPAHADERILSFHSDITVHPDSSMTVCETIKVRATGDKIKRGIYRDFPTSYKDSYGNNYKVGFEVVSAQRDGQPVNYWIEGLLNGKRIYMGDKKIYLDPGEYTFALTYQTNRQLGFFPDHDELYWNVTGNGWEFPIDSASARVELPAGAAEKILNFEAYTGYQGSKDRDYLSSTEEIGKISFLTTRALNSNEGLTIVVSWPKGFTAEPTKGQKIKYLLQDNLNAIAGIIGLIILLIYYLWVWSKFGKDPTRGVIIPLYEPPKGLSPASCRFISKMGFDQKAFAAAVVGLGVKGYLTIEEENGEYTIRSKENGTAELLPDEKKIYNDIISIHKVIRLTNTNHEVVSDSIDLLKNFLVAHYEKNYFFSNIQYFMEGLFISVVLLVVTILSSGSGEELAAAVFMSIWLTGWSFGVFFLLRQTGAAWRAASAGRHRLGNLAQAIFLSLFSIPFIFGEIMGIGMLTFTASFITTIILSLVVFINCLFYFLLKAPTVSGRSIMDQIEGFKMYLSVAEKDRMNFFNAPGKTPDLFEKYLPYAMALDVENAWAEQFTEVFKQAGIDPETYHPAWYAGSSYLGASALASSFGSSFSSAISSSSVAPGSSSGFGGGGGSGGGGGGGGGGGF